MRYSKIVFTIICALFLLLNTRVQAQAVKPIGKDSFLAILNTQHLNQPIIFNFWATWCKPCIEELPYFMQLDSALGKDSIALVFLSFDSPSNPQKVEKFVRSKNIKGIHYLINDVDLDAFITAVNPDWEGNIPYTILFNAHGRKDHGAAFNNLAELLIFIKNDVKKK